MNLKAGLIGLLLATAVPNVADSAEIWRTQVHKIGFDGGSFTGHEGEFKEYKIEVQNGDALTTIVDQLNVLGLQSSLASHGELITVKDLLRYNPTLTVSSIIQPGQILKYWVTKLAPGITSYL